MTTYCVLSPVLGTNDKAVNKAARDLPYGTHHSAGRHVTTNFRNYPRVTIMLGGTAGRQRVLEECVKGV